MNNMLSGIVMNNMLSITAGIVMSNMLSNCVKAYTSIDKPIYRQKCTLAFYLNYVAKSFDLAGTSCLFHFLCRSALGCYWHPWWLIWSDKLPPAITRYGKPLETTCTHENILQPPMGPKQYLQVIGEQAKLQGDTIIRGIQIRAGAVYICMEVRYIYIWRYVCHNSSACHAYVMWAELGYCHFL